MAKNIFPVQFVIEVEEGLFGEDDPKDAISLVAYVDAQFTGPRERHVLGTVHTTDGYSAAQRPVEEFVRPLLRSILDPEDRIFG